MSKTAVLTTPPDSTAHEGVESGTGINENLLALLPEEFRQELRCYLALKPYIAHCIAMNHDLNNPLAGIIGYSELMIEDSATPPEIREQLKQILTCALRIHYFVDQLCLEKIEQNQKISLKDLEELYRPLALAFEGPIDPRDAG